MIEETLGTCETKDSEWKIQEAARTMDDQILLLRIIGIDMIAKEVKYHHSCRSDYLKSAQRRVAKSGIPTAAEDTRNSLEEIHSYIESSVIVNKRPELLTSIYTRYMDM